VGLVYLRVCACVWAVNVVFECICCSMRLYVQVHHMILCRTGMLMDYSFVRSVSRG